MAKRIVVLSDGTGNSAAKLSKTNVWRLYQALDLSDPSEQIAWYDDGVGTSSFQPLAILGGALGWGVRRNVLDLYRFICRNYRDGDRIFCFGFSRGAFTARFVAGLIATEGIVGAASEAELEAKTEKAYEQYRSERFPSILVQALSPRRKTRRKNPSGSAFPNIAFLGLWDTVAAYGLPIDEMTRAVNWVFRFYPNTRDAGPKYERICHALALDDERHTFHPMLFNEATEPSQNQNTTCLKEERISQVWFPGMHSNVGGGYPDDGMSYIPLQWIADQARDSGLLIDEDQLHRILGNANPVGKIYDSRRGLGGLYRYMPRRMASLCNDTRDKEAPVRIARPKIHESVFRRIQGSIDGYAPLVLPEHYAVVLHSGEIVPADRFLEHETQALDRARRQDKIWNLVWRKRVLYFTTIAAALTLAAFPLIWPSVGTCKWRTCGLSPAIGWLGRLLPASLDPWLQAFQENPAPFAVVLAIFGLLLWRSHRLQRRIFDQMRAVWARRVQNPREQVVSAREPSDLLFRVRTSRLYDRIVVFGKWKLLPALFGAVMVTVLFAGVFRLSFQILDSAGWICGSSQPVAGALSTANFCSAVPDPGSVMAGAPQPYEVKEGRSYSATLSIVDKNNFSDKTIKAGLGGFDRAEMPPSFRLIHPLAVFFRRNLDENWFKPILRVGHWGTDEYPLNPVDDSRANADTVAMISKFTARRSGPLYFYVNDGVIPWPYWQPFYNNNRGRVILKVEELQSASVQAQ